MIVLLLLGQVTAYSAVLYLAILLFRKLFRGRISATLQYGIWFLLVLRLLLPVTIDSGFSVIVLPEPARQAVQADYAPPDQEGAFLPVSGQEAGPASAPGDEAGGTAPQTANQPQNAYQQPQGRAQSSAWDTGRILLTIWSIGMAVAFAWFLALYVRLSRRIKRSKSALSPASWRIFCKVKSELGVKGRIRPVIADSVSTPALTVSLFPKLLMPPSEFEAPALGEEELENVFRHELTHYKRGDHLVCLMLTVLRCVYWFNSVVWLAARQMQLDMEISCDSIATRNMDTDRKKRYASTILAMFSRTGKPQLAMGMGMESNRTNAERRIRGVFMNARSKKSTRIAAALTAVMLFVTCFTTACKPVTENTALQPGPSATASANAPKSTGSHSPAASVAPEATTAPTAAPVNNKYTAPAEWKQTFEPTKDKLMLDMQAKLTVPDYTAWPLVNVSWASITQQQADSLMKVLLDGKPLLKHDNRELVTKLELQQRIAVYDDELRQIKPGDKSMQNLRKTYTEMIKQYQEQLKTAPEERPTDPASTALAPMLTQRASIHFGKYVETVENGETVRKLSNPEEVLQKAAEAGMLAIEGDVDLGRDTRGYLQIQATNKHFYDSVGFSAGEARPMPDMKPAPGVTMTMEQAMEKAKKAIADMGFDKAVLTGWKLDNIGYMPEGTTREEEIPSQYTLEFQNQTEGLQLADISTYVRRVAYNGERMSIGIDDKGISGFSWSFPTTETGIAKNNVDLLAFDSIKGIAAKELMKLNWKDDAIKEAASCRLLINKVILSYMPVATEYGSRDFVMTPVWDFCGQVIYKLKPGTKGYVVDKNNEYVQFGREGEQTLSLLTLSAVDGSVIDRANLNGLVFK